MLDSLVRVSRRVGGAADLLATEMRAVPDKGHSLYEPAHVPAGPEARRRRGSGNKAPNFTRALGPVPAVRRVKGWRNAATGSAHRRAGSSRIPNAAAAPPASLNLQPRLRERLRLPLHSFTYS